MSKSKKTRQRPPEQMVEEFEALEDEVARELAYEALEAITTNRLTFWVDVAPEMRTISARGTLYNYGLNNLDTLKEALRSNRSRSKRTMREEWERSDKPALQLALYKLYAEPEEFKRLSMSQMDLSSDGKPIMPVIKIEVNPNEVGPRTEEEIEDDTLDQ